MLKDGAYIMEITTTTGAGTLTLAGALPGCNTFVSKIGNANSCFYYLHDANGRGKEFGIGTVAANGTLARTTVLESSNSNAAIVLTAGTHTVFVGPAPGYATGDVNFQDLVLQRPEIKDYSETVQTPSIVGGVLTINLELGGIILVNQNNNISSIVVQNPPVAGKCGSFILTLKQDATGGRTTIIPSNWISTNGGTAPTLVTTANKRNRFVVDTTEGGTEYLYALAGSGF